jgi:hypothetical protein
VTTPAKSALDAAREMLEQASRESVQVAGRPACFVRRDHLRLVLDALREAERPRHEIAFAYSMKHGWPICGKCGLVIHDGSPYCANRLPSIDTRDSDMGDDCGNPEDWE